MKTIRDQIKDLNFLNSCINERYASHLRRIEKFVTNYIAVDRIQSVRVDMAKNLLYLGITRYSAGDEIDSWKESLNEIVELFDQYWSGYWKLKNSNGIALDQYGISSYDEMLWVLSLGYLLDIPEIDFLKLVDVIDRDGVKDNLFEFIIRAKLNERKPIIEESYKDFFGVPNLF
ncbi:MAG: DUF1910 domain-containing protein [Crocinitomicaceae bacterium]|nr:DUF1910 domain-containing protein [Crocinitomicaceae bacterium]